MKDEFVARVDVWRQRHYNYIIKKRPTVIIVMGPKGTLGQYLTDLNCTTQEKYNLLITKKAEPKQLRFLVYFQVIYVI